MVELRVAVVVVALCGQAATVAAGILPLAVLLVGAPVLIGLALVAALADPARHALLRSVATALAGLACGGSLLVVGLEARPALVGVLVAVTCAAALSWLTPRDLRTGLLCGVALLVAAGAWAEDALVGPALLLGWVAALVAALRLPRALLAADSTVLQPAPPAGLPRRSSLDLVPAAALALVLAVVAFLLLPAAPSPAGGPGPGDLGTRAKFSSPVMDLTERVGTPSDTPVLEVDSASPALWRSTVYDRYDGSRWTVGDRTGGRVPGPPFVLADATGPARTDLVRTSRHDGTVWAPGAPLALVGDGMPGVFADDQGVVRLGGPVDWYGVQSQLPVTDPAVLRAASGPDVDDPRWLQLPSGLPDRVRALAADVTAGTTTRIDAVRAVEQWLGSNASYRLDPPVPGRGEDAVDRFLFVDRIGYCQQFAAASTVLLRAVGIPARVVTGLGYGIDGADRRTYQVRHLHAWTEVYHPGIGWVPSDATPAADSPLEVTAGAGDAGTPRQWLAEAVAAARERVPESVRGRALVAALVTAVLVAAAGGWFLLRRRTWRPVRERGARTGGGTELSAGPALAAFLRFDARLGPAARRRAESLSEMRQRFDAPGEVGQALGVVERECYAPAPPPQARQAAAVLDACGPDDAGGIRR
jgi:protein-glutamine gamma-glutamyltransferase